MSARRFVFGFGGILFAFAAAGSAAAQELVEDFPDPLGEWQERWLFENSNLQSVYIADGSDCDPDFRGNNPCGLWLADCRECACGIEGREATIKFDPEFAARISHLEFDLSAHIGTSMIITDADGNVLLDVPDVVQTLDVCEGFQYSVDSQNGVGGIHFECNEDCPEEGVEGNTALDNVRVVLGGQGCLYKLKKNSKAKKGCQSCPRKNDIYASGDQCEGNEDCKKKLKIKKIGCPDGQGLCKKIKGKRDSCSQ